MNVLTYFPKSRLKELVSRFGGMNRDDAVKAAAQEIQVLKPDADVRIAKSISELEAIVTIAVRTKKCGPDEMKAMLPLCDQIVTLAGTYGYTPLDKAARSLCDLLDGMIGAGKNDIRSITVHTQTIRMVAPSAAPLAPEHIDLMLLELAKVLDYHGISTLGSGVREGLFEGMSPQAV